MSKIRVFELKLDSHGIPLSGGKYIRLPSPFEPYILRFNLQGASAVCRKGVFLTNYPFAGQDFKRETFHAIPLKPDFSKAIQLDIWIARPGAYCYQIEYEPLPPWDPLDEKPQSTKNKLTRESTEEHYFSVEPALRINGKELPLAGLAIQSVTAKWMGSIGKWSKFFKVFSNKGYNMLHFTPLNYRGDSNSPYSIYDQLSFAPDLFPKGTTVSEQHAQISQMTAMMEKDFGLLSLTDVVWNHTAENSDWLQDHPEAGYNLYNSPHLISAYQLDSALIEFSSNLRHLGYPTVLNSIDDLLKIMEGIKTHVLGGLRLWEFYIVESAPTVAAALTAWKKGKYDDSVFDRVKFAGMSLYDKAKTVAAQGLEGGDTLGERFQKELKSSIAAAYLASVYGDYSDAKVAEAQRDLTSVINEINLPFYRQFDSDRETIQENIFNRVKYIRLDLKRGEITPESPLVEPLFTRLPHNERTLVHPKGSLALANNGWIWANNPLEDFASAKSRSYLRREVIVWGDCVKLRYGRGPEDNPWLWQHMIDYTCLMAQHFHGFRIDNCHSTPLHVGSYFLDRAREVRPDLYICAELFTGSEEMDVIFVSHLGISSLIREAMQAWGPQELSRLVHRHGGKPIGSIDTDALVRHGLVGDEEADVYPLTSQPVNPLFFDCTHDNETPNQRRVAHDTLPTGALVSMCAASTGSVMGYDEIFPHLLDLVGESRLYAPEEEQPGIGKTKGILNRLHTEMALEGYTETHVHHEGDYITVHRVCPQTHKGYFLIAHTAFNGSLDRGNINPIVLPGTKAEVILCQRLQVYGDSKDKDDRFLRGLASKLDDIDHPSITVGSDWQGEFTTIVVPKFFPGGSICLLRTSVDNYDDAIDAFVRSGADETMSKLDLVDLNALLYRCDGEERDLTDGKDGAYDVPGYGSLVYCGLEGWIFPLRGIIRENNLAHPLCNHLRQGYWAMDHTVARLKKHAAIFPGLKDTATWFDIRFKRIKEVPQFLAPKLFAIVMQTAYNAARHRALSLLGDNIKHGTEFVQSLAMTSVQLHGKVYSTSLNPQSIVPCLAAGLPHFSFDYMRCWGRDVFISARGLFLGTGRYEDAKNHILAFAAMLKHGMIPNLLDAGRRPRYNSRDSIWFFLQLIQDYTKIVPKGLSLLDERVKRRFPLDDEFVWADDPKAYSYESTIAEIIFEVMSRHANGLHFREAHAGSGLDSQMTDLGFNIDIFVDWENGMIFGGNQHNCGTWMDKMGESAKAGNKGVPGTPRNGAAIEITGLLKSALSWLTKLYADGVFKHKGVTVKGENGFDKLITWKQWNEKIQKNFERCYYVPENSRDFPHYDLNPQMVNRRGIYKDLYRCSAEWADYQFRPNFAIAMVVAPELFDPAKALGCLKIADEVLRGPTGMRTLDPKDLAYRPNYINSDDSDDFTVAKGRNYHQGPEWLWCTGFFLRAFLKFDVPTRTDTAGRVETLQQLHSRLYHHRRMIEESPWAGFVELTNKDGAVCHDACDTQAWSMGTLLDLMHDTSALEL